MERREAIYDGAELVSETFLEVSWEQLRSNRDAELVQTDPWALSDRTMSQEQIDYREFLRDLPGDHDSANEAADAWAAYDKPE
jgi:hypothetical protein